MKHVTHNRLLYGRTGLMIWFLIFSVILLEACSFGEKVIDETYPDGSPKRELICKGRGEKRVILKETQYYPNGQIMLTGKYREGERDGYWIYYFENGNKWSEGFYKKGENDGKRLTYFENGRLRYEAWYTNGKRSGLWKFFDEAGNLIKEVDYSSPR
jgi:antitoxin component YwqK of YwqJK toxin-antitoxin module